MVDKKDLGLRIKLARRKFSQENNVKFTQHSLAEKINVSRSYIGDIESGRTYPTFIVLKAIAEACDVPLVYLTEEDEAGEDSSIFEAAKESDPPLVTIPILGVIQAGEPIMAYQNVIGYEYLPFDIVKSDRYFGLKVIGDSMNNSRIHDGDIVLVRSQEEVENGEIAVVLVNGENATIKKFFKTDSMITLMPDSSNKEHYPKFFDITKSEVRVLGKVMKVIISL